MNIFDVSEVEKPEDENYLRAIFDRQLHLHEKYKPIEHASGIGLALIKNRPFDINDKIWQYVIKDFCWRVVEELAECTEAIDKARNAKMGSNLHELETNHAIEEAIDALHFYTELLIMTEIQWEKIMNFESRPVISPIILIIDQMGLACNCLKNKPWKQTHIITDEQRFFDHLIKGYIYLFNYLRSFSLSLEEIYVFYMKKSEVNKFRQRSNY